MKKLLIVVLFSISIISLSAASPTDSTPVGLTVEDVDILNVKVFESDEETTIGAETNAIDLVHNDTYSVWQANYWLRIQVTTTHRIKISIGTDGPLKADSTTDTIDVNITQMYGYWETSEEYLPISELWISKKDDYTDKDYYEIGTAGVLTVNDASMGWGWVQVPDENIKGKKATNYSTNIVVKATVV